MTRRPFLSVNAIDSQPTVRRLVTRLISSIPAATVAAAVGQSGLNTMLVASQVLLSIILPTVIFPLVLLCSKDDVMTVEGPNISSSGETSPLESEATDRLSLSPGAVVPSAGTANNDGGVGSPALAPNDDSRRTKSYKSPLWITILGYVLFSIVVIANAYVIVQLILGNA